MPPRRRARYDEDAAPYGRRGSSGMPVEEDGPYDEAEGEDEHRSERGDDRAAEPRRRRAALNAVSAGRLGLRYIADLTSKDTEGVTSVEPVENGWLVDVEVVEDHRIPSTGDMLSIYECQVDDEGNLMSYRRTRTYRRGTGAYGGGL
ncbi:gas vesicle protein GvpO [Microbispora catharanthi]|uniref:Gas vesicle protein n=1 Tax=Microbispora catharanthi TaxID=1712871 RepID=A0A5N6BP93_9ACTN|nr:gas vesicle protein GvpO [Microbispora catharanthi]KAB8181963.1 gas vesicle protein [Microbispora catharanthi]